MTRKAGKADERVPPPTEHHPRPFANNARDELDGSISADGRRLDREIELERIRHGVRPCSRERYQFLRPPARRVAAPSMGSPVRLRGADHRVWYRTCQV